MTDRSRLPRFQTPVRLLIDSNQPGARPRDHETSDSEQDAAEDSHRRGISPVQQDFAMGCLTRGIIETSVYVSPF